MKPPLNHMMLHEDTLADEFDAILGYRASHSGLVLPGDAGFVANAIDNGGTRYLTRAGGSGGLTGTIDGFTLSMWLYAESVVSTDRYFRGARTAAADIIAVHLSGAGSLTCAATATGGSDHQVNTISLNAWHHIFYAATADLGWGSLAYLIIDGVEQFYGEPSGGAITAGWPLDLMTWGVFNFNNGTSIPDGRIAQVQLFKTYQEEYARFWDGSGELVDPSQFDWTGWDRVFLLDEPAATFGTNADGDGVAFTAAGSGAFTDATPP